MSRIRMLPVETWDQALREQTGADAATPLEQGAMRAFAHIPEIAKGLAAFATAVRQHRNLPERLVELVRLRIAFHNQCRSCMAIRYRDAHEAGVDEALVCSLELPAEAENLTPAEKAALAYADRFANDHLSIDDAVYDGLRRHFTEAEIVELGVWVAFCVGFGRLGATWDMVEELPSAFLDRSADRLAPWNADYIVVR
ncbi:MAG TPA: carboxymuconolactone decarboxylase family protein [Stellaceae bacterium]|nr:carboxymuconolactone decarboxylase family protein [Stellaceae bacterium]